MKRLVGILAVLVMGVSAQAGVVSVSFGNGGGTVLAPAGVAGVEAAANWNNVYNNGGTGLECTSPIALNNSEGIASGANLTYKFGASYYNSNNSDTDMDYRMMEGWMALKADDAGSVTLTGLDEMFAAGYNVYVYFDSNEVANARTMAFTIGTQTIFGKESNESNFAGEFIQATGSSYENASVGNFVLFEGLTGSSFSLMADANSGRAAISGIQIVSVPEPATMVLLGLGSLCVIRRKK